MASHHVYILFSEKLNRFYIGNTDLSPNERLHQHNEKFNLNTFTTKGIPWQLFLVLDCSSRKQAQKVEAHIKKMKSKKYIQNLSQFSEMREKLLVRFE